MSTHVGAVARRTRTITKRDIELFTEISGDRNPIHYDEDLAAQSRFGRVVVQGGVTSGLLNAVVAEDLPGPGSVFLEVSWRFLAPVGPGDEITAEVTVTSVREDKPITTLDTSITNQDGVVVLDRDGCGVARPRGRGDSSLPSRPDRGISREGRGKAGFLASRPQHINRRLSS